MKRIPNIFVTRIQDLAKNSKYFFEHHSVSTMDGYILSTIRITLLDYSKQKNNLEPILLQHGLLDSSDGWLCNNEDKCIPLILAKNGYDVWISNSRGNKYSKNHETLSPLKGDFWNFSFHEMGKYDIPAILTHISTNRQNNKKIIYIGHSLGGAIIFSGISENIEFYSKFLKAVIGLAPATRMDNIQSHPINFLSSFRLHSLFKKYSCREYNSFNPKYNLKAALFAQKHPRITNSYLDILSEKESIFINNQDFLPAYLSQFPSGTSLKNFFHTSQIFQNKRFCKYDYGKEENLIRYNRVIPPSYNLRSIKDLNIILVSGDYDKLVPSENVEWLYNQVKHKNNVFYKEFKKMGHLTFLIGNDMNWFEEIMNNVRAFK